jgi:hypothetical protein
MSNFKLCAEKLSFAYATGKEFAQTVAPIIILADEARKPAMLDAASDKFSETMGKVEVIMIGQGANPADTAEHTAHAAAGFADHIVILTNP